ncbi:hypothetical protein HZH66_011752 [Vespula vulgaris]|uniref:Uncharacterized protein n=1 Tax=Vespula vulgaris TaxID=7454 RepID=A0A834MVE7_VESVU|nr:protein lethal(2)essential for life-like [Vespula vulgaris]KAF7385910.1 hypothetical protein HZH66_011752 [Vespula vulgaris]
MSSLPILFSNWWENLDRPHRIFDQHFDLSFNPKNLLSSWTPYDRNTDLLIYRPRRHFQHRHHPYNRSMTRKTSGTSNVVTDKNKFQVTLDVQKSVPDEVTVKVVKKNVMVEDRDFTTIIPKKISELEEKERIIKTENTEQPSLKDDVSKPIEAQKEQGLQTEKNAVQQREQDKTVKAA